MSFHPTVLVYEFFTGGGCLAGELPKGPAAEGLGMLWALLADFRSWGAVRTLAPFDPRFEERVPGLNRNSLPADEVVCALQGSHQETYLSLLERSDAAIIIAPETDGILARLTAQAESAGIPVLGSSAPAVRTAGDKGACARIFRKANLPAPATRIVSFEAAVRAAEQIGCPLVIKPVDGAGSEGVCRVDRLSGLETALKLVRRATSRDHIVLQSLAFGIHVSVSMLVSGEGRLPLSLNRQLIEDGFKLRYLGSRVPFRQEAVSGCMDLACSAVSLIPGLSGYLGVDLVVTEDSAQLIEINPRLTTSYIGLRQVAGLNLARAIWEACVNGVLPERMPLSGRVTVMKDDPGTWGLTVREDGERVSSTLNSVRGYFPEGMR